MLYIPLSAPPPPDFAHSVTRRAPLLLAAAILSVFALLLLFSAAPASAGFSDLESAQTSPSGMWSPDGSTLWVGQWSSDQIYAYNLSDDTYNSSKNWSLTNPGTGDKNIKPTGIWSNSTHIYVTDGDHGRVFQYNLGDKTLTSNDYSLDSGNAKRQGIWSNGTTAWVSDSDDDKLYAYRLSNFARQSGNDIDLRSGNGDARDIWSDGTTMWVLDNVDEKIYAYVFPGGAGDAKRDIALDSAGVNYNSIWSDGTRMYIIENTSGSSTRDPAIHTRALTTGTAPAAITNLTARTENVQTDPTWDLEAQAILAWAVPDDNDWPITKFQYRQATGQEGYGRWRDIAGSGQTSNTYHIRKLNDGVSYSFQVRAVNAGGAGPNSNDAPTWKERLDQTLDPAAVTFLEAFPGDQRATLTWTLPSYSPNTNEFHYRQQRRDGSYGGWRGINNSDETTRSHTVSGLTNGVDYTFQVRAANDLGRFGHGSNEYTVRPRAATVLLSNFGQSSSSNDGAYAVTGAGRPRAQFLSTGRGSTAFRKYQLDSVSLIPMQSTKPSNLKVTIRTVGRLFNPTDTVVATLVNPASFSAGQKAVFTAPPGTQLDGGEPYAIHIAADDGLRLKTGLMNEGHLETGQPGWELFPYLVPDTPNLSWSNSADGSAFKIEIRGSEDDTITTNSFDRQASRNSVDKVRYYRFGAGPYLELEGGHRYHISVERLVGDPSRQLERYWLWERNNWDDNIGSEASGGYDAIAGRFNSELTAASSSSFRVGLTHHGDGYARFRVKVIEHGIALTDAVAGDTTTTHGFSQTVDVPRSDQRRINSRIEHSKDEDWFRVELEANKAYDFLVDAPGPPWRNKGRSIDWGFPYYQADAREPGNWAPYNRIGEPATFGLYDGNILGVYDSSGKLMPDSSNEDWKFEGSNNKTYTDYGSRVRYRPSVSGTYYVAVGSGRGHIGEYELLARRATGNYTNDQNTSDDRLVGFGSLRSAEATAATSPPVFIGVEGVHTTRQLPEGSSPGTLVGYPVSAYSPDGGPIDYELFGEDRASFNIDPNTGQLTTVAGVDYDYDVKPTYRVVVQAADEESEIVTVVVTIELLPSSNTPATGAPTISGTAQVGETLTADTSGIADDDGLADAAFSYQWQSDDADIAGATGSSYTLTDSDEGKAISVAVSFTDDVGNAEALASAATAAVDAAPNSPATGAPGISGTVQVGQTLTVDTSGIADEDGLDNAAFSYQWVANDGTEDADISGATDSTYTLTFGEADKTVTVRVSFTDDAGNEETLTSAATDAVVATSQQQEAEPTDRPHGLTAQDLDGAVVLTWNEPVVDYRASSYHILRHRPELGEPEPLVYVDQTPNNDTTYTDTDVEQGALYVYSVRAIVNFFGDLSDASTPVEIRVSTSAPEPEPTANTPATGQPAISGTAQVGETLTASTSGIADEDGLDNASFSYQWQADGLDISGVTDSTYTLVAADEGKAISVKVSFTDNGENSESLTSEPTDNVAAAPATNSPATGLPSINGTAQVGETLTADTSGIADDDGLSNASFTYQWQADGAEISGETSDAYTLADADEGKAITVTVSFTDDAGNDESLTSDATAAVEAKPNAPATGAPSIVGTAQVGETLTADTSGIADADGVSNASFTYQWQADSVDIAGATGSSYTLTDADEGKTVSVQVSFTDDAGHSEEVTSAATAPVTGLPPEPLTASFENPPSSHDGENVFTFELRFSEEFGISYRTLRDHAFTVTGGAVKKAKRLEQGSNVLWRITVRPGGTGQVVITLPVTTDCGAQGAICTGDDRMLSSRLELTVGGPGQ